MEDKKVGYCYNCMNKRTFEFANGRFCTKCGSFEGRKKRGGLPVGELVRDGHILEKYPKLARILTIDDYHSSTINDYHSSTIDDYHSSTINDYYSSTIDDFVIERKS